MRQLRSSIAAIAAVLFAASCGGGEAARDGLGVVLNIVDGDTVDIRINGKEERVRLIGIDTPETKKPDAPVECYGPEATTHTLDLLPVGTRVRIERDIVGRDNYGRLLGYLYRVDDELFVNYEMLRQGYARPLTIEPNSTHSVTFAAAARLAEADDLGLWAACVR
jgi:micrococcal nuclease